MYTGCTTAVHQIIDVPAGPVVAHPFDFVGPFALVVGRPAATAGPLAFAPADRQTAVRFAALVSTYPPVDHLAGPLAFAPADLAAPFPLFLEVGLLHFEIADWTGQKLDLTD